MRSKPAQVAEQVGVGAAGVFEVHRRGGQALKGAAKARNSGRTFLENARCSRNTFAAVAGGAAF
jgi:hypothetical protein